MTARLSGAAALGLLLAALALAALSAAPALAVEEDEFEVPEEEELPDFEELCEEGTLAAEYCPERYEEPSWFQWMTYPLLIVGLLVVTALLMLYLFWQPRFSREDEGAKR